jgi:hypothetical protein
MDSRILSVSEKLARDIFKLNPAYESTQCNIKSTTIDLKMSNGLIPITISFPRTLIEDSIETIESAGDVETIKRMSEEEDEPINENNEELENQEEDNKPARKLVRKKARR